MIRLLSYIMLFFVSVYALSRRHTNTPPPPPFTIASKTDLVLRRFPIYGPLTRFLSQEHEWLKCPCLVCPPKKHIIQSARPENGIENTMFIVA